MYDWGKRSYMTKPIPQHLCSQFAVQGFIKTEARQKSMPEYPVLGLFGGLSVETLLSSRLQHLSSASQGMKLSLIAKLCSGHRRVTVGLLFGHLAVSSAQYHFLILRDPTVWNKCNFI